MIGRFWIMDTGFCTALEHHLIVGGKHQEVRCHALAFLLEHPQHGLILFDTGYAPRVLEAFGRFPFSIYGLLTPTTTKQAWSVVEQLKHIGFGPGDIAHLIVSHLHADHVGGLLDFPKVKLVISKPVVPLLEKRGFAALRQGILPMLLPEDFLARAKVIPGFHDAALGPFAGTHDLFGDGSLRLLALPGHARGQMGLLAQTSLGPVLLASDGCWLSESYRQNKAPAWLPMHLLFDDAAETKCSVSLLHELHLGHPKTWIVPTHCPEIAALLEPGIPRIFDQDGVLPGQATLNPPQETRP